MRRTALILSIIVLTTVLVVIAHFLYNESVLKKSVTENKGDYVVLLHGLGRSPFSMQKIGKHLAQEGIK
ncbi:hypothetical protein COY07_05100 [Candidatus Peregrinibacteria bacterium CG_4_10_14_0_2_um_filter_43_11]|nr:MAG: hypothetical protein COY07_05100 [Candidatus Peregrinibacteria bacterium CG_4_10_14_0_2_um_filter_43_11]